MYNSGHLATEECGRTPNIGQEISGSLWRDNHTNRNMREELGLADGDVGWGKEIKCLLPEELIPLKVLRREEKVV